VELKWTPPDDPDGSHDPSVDDDTRDDGSHGTSESTEPIPDGGGVSDGEAEAPEAASAQVAMRTGLRMGIIGAVVVVLLVIAYLILGRQRPCKELRKPRGDRPRLRRYRRRRSA
jgi:hypothetical protein